MCGLKTASDCSLTFDPYVTVMVGSQQITSVINTVVKPFVTKTVDAIITGVGWKEGSKSFKMSPVAS